MTRKRLCLPFYVDGSDMKPPSYDGSSNMNNQLSQERTMMEDKVDDASMPSQRYYNENLPLFG